MIRFILDSLEASPNEKPIKEKYERIRDVSEIVKRDETVSECAVSYRNPCIYQHMFS